MMCQEKVRYMDLFIYILGHLRFHWFLVEFSNPAQVDVIED